MEDDRGLSPRPRGSRHHYHLWQVQQGSIPASAGKPPVRRCSVERTRVYPRVRGEAKSRCTLMPRLGGLSPRPRGSHRFFDHVADGLGSIPASAGKPPPSAGTDWHFGVYPRVRGEAIVSSTTSLTAWGLSPRPRGSRHRPPAPIGTSGSIPASAGKPPGRSRRRTDRRVYPRVRGEAVPRLRRE